MDRVCPEVLRPQELHLLFLCLIYARHAESRGNPLGGIGAIDVGETDDDKIQAANRGISFVRQQSGVSTYPSILASSSSACSLKSAILLQGFSLSPSWLALESGLYTIPVLSSKKIFTFRFAASRPMARDKDRFRSLYTSSSCE